MKRRAGFALVTRLAFAAGLIAALTVARPASPLAREKWMVARPTVAADTSDILPFARNEIPETFPSVGFAIGLAKPLAGFTTVERAFQNLEDTYRAGGFPVPRAGAVDLVLMVMPTFKVRLNRWLDVACQMGRSTGPRDELKLMGGLVSGRHTLRADNVSLFAGLGAGAYGFSFKRDYGAQITAVDSNGGHYRLESLTLRGGGRYWTTAGGLTIRTGKHGAFEVLVQYLGTGDVSTALTRAGDVSLNISGAMIGVSSTIFF